MTVHLLKWDVQVGVYKRSVITLICWLGDHVNHMGCRKTVWKKCFFSRTFSVLMREGWSFCVSFTLFYLCFVLCFLFSLWFKHVLHNFWWPQIQLLQICLWKWRKILGLVRFKVMRFCFVFKNAHKGKPRTIAPAGHYWSLLWIWIWVYLPLTCHLKACHPLCAMCIKCLLTYFSTKAKSILYTILYSVVLSSYVCDHSLICFLFFIFWCAFLPFYCL